MSTPVFLTEPEVAELLRCSTTKIKRLRFSGKLAYIPGRPVLIDKADLEIYLAEVKQERLTKEEQEELRRARRGITWGHPDPRIWAMHKKLFPRIRRGKPPA